MKLDFRDFFYLDSDYVNNLLGHITGYIEKEYSEVEKEGKSKKGTGNLDIGIAKGGVEDSSTKGKEVTRKGTVNSEIRYKKLFDYLKDKGLLEVENFNDESWEELINEDEFIEIRGSIHFSQLYDLERDINYLGNVGSDLGLIDNEEVGEVKKQISVVMKHQEKNGIPLRIETFNSEHKFIAYLNNKYLLKSQNEIIGNDYKILCKIERKIPFGKDHALFDLDEIEKKYTNRSDRRNKNKKPMPDQLSEKVSGPAAIILPIAIYR